MLIRISRESLPELSDVQERPLDELERKYELLKKSFKRLYEAKTMQYLKIGYKEDEALKKSGLRRN